MSVKNFVTKYINKLPKEVINSDDRQKHIKNINKYESIVAGEHLNVYREGLHPVYVQNYVVDNVTSDGLDLKIDLMTKDFFEVYAQKNKDMILNYIQEFDLKNLVATQMKDSVRLGNSFLYFDFKQNDRDVTKYKFVPRIAHPSSVWYVKSNGGYQYEYDYMFIEQKEGKINETEYVTLYIHSKVDFGAYRYKIVDGDYQYMQELSYHRHNIGKFLIFNFKNKADSNFIAPSDMSNTVINKQGRLNVLNTVEDKVVLDWANPFWLIDTGTADNLASSGDRRIDGEVEIQKKEGKFLRGSEKSEFYVEKLEPAGYISELIDKKEKMRDEILNALSIDSSLYREVKETGQVQSGAALEQENFKTINNIKSKLEIYAERWTEIFRVILILENIENGTISDINDVEIKYSVLLFSDAFTKLEMKNLELDVYKKMRDLGLFISLETITRAVENFTDEEMAVEKQKIASEPQPTQNNVVTNSNSVVSNNKK